MATAGLVTLLSSLAVAGVSERLLERYRELHDRRAALASTWSQLPPAESDDGEVVWPNRGPGASMAPPVSERGSDKEEVVEPGRLSDAPSAIVVGAFGEEVVVPESGQASSMAPPIPAEAPPRAESAPPPGGQERGKFVLGPGPGETPRKGGSPAALLLELILVGGNLVLVYLAGRRSRATLERG